MKAMLFGLAVILLVGVGCAQRTAPVNPLWSPSPAQAKLIDFVAQRLELADEVAWYKYREGLPVLDREREAASLKSLVAQGESMGLQARTVRRFFQAQMTASRMVQADLMKLWKAGGPLPTTPPRDLKQEIRPELDAINAGLLTQLASAGSPELAARASRYLRARGLPEAASAMAVSPLK